MNGTEKCAFVMFVIKLKLDFFVEQTTLMTFFFCNRLWKRFLFLVIMELSVSFKALTV